MSTHDPVAQKSGFLCMYMSSHPDTLVAYAKWFGKVDAVIKSAEMTAIDSKSMTLTCTLENSSRSTVAATEKIRKEEVYIPIVPPLRGYDDVKPRLLEMKALAQEGLGMIKTPHISTFTFTRAMGISGVLVLFVAYLAYSPESSTSLPYYPANVVRQFVSTGIVRFISNTVFSLHALESFYTWHLCRKHQTGFGVGALYITSTLICGAPVWWNLRQTIQTARIESVMKVE